MWHYLCFIVLVKVKDSTEYTGPESYVAEMIKVSGQGSWRGLQAGFPIAAQCRELAGTTTAMSAHPLSWARCQALELHVSSQWRSPRWGVISILKEEILRLREMSIWLPNRTGVSPCISRSSWPSMSMYSAFFLFVPLFLMFIFHCTEPWLLLGFFSSCGKQMLLLLQCLGFSWQWLLLLWSTGSRHMGSAVVVPRLRCPSACWFFPWPGIESVFPALAGVFLTTGPAGKPTWPLLLIMDPCLFFLLM